MKTEFTQQGHTHKFIEKTGEWSIYERSSKMKDYSSDGVIPHYEVVRPVKRLGCLPDGKPRKDKYGYPSTSRFGLDGFTLMTLDAARKKINQLNQTT